MYRGVHRFELDAPPTGHAEPRRIEQFVSPIGNNDVAYPYARDNYNYVYLLEPSCMVRLEWKHAAAYQPGVPLRQQLPYYSVHYRSCVEPFASHFAITSPEGEQYTACYKARATMAPNTMR